MVSVTAVVFVLEECCDESINVCERSGSFGDLEIVEHNSSDFSLHDLNE